jgi:hypothetical protein
VEWLLTRIYGKYKVTVKQVQVLANSVCVTVTVSVTNPITLEVEEHDGVGACPIQTDKGAGAMDWNAAKSDGVMKALPAAKSYAFKDAAENFGKVFGKDLGRKDAIGYDMLMKAEVVNDWGAMVDLFDLKQYDIPPAEFAGISMIIENRNEKEYKKTFNYLTKL